MSSNISFTSKNKTKKNIFSDHKLVIQLEKLTYRGAFAEYMRHITYCIHYYFLLLVWINPLCFYDSHHLNIYIFKQNWSRNLIV